MKFQVLSSLLAITTATSCVCPDTGIVCKMVGNQATYPQGGAGVSSDAPCGSGCCSVWDANYITQLILRGR